MGIFDAFAESGGVEMTAQELSSKTKGDYAFLGKIFSYFFSFFFPPLPLNFTQCPLCWSREEGRRKEAANADGYRTCLAFPLRSPAL